MDSGQGCITLWMHLIPLNCASKNGWNGKFYIYFSIIERERARANTRFTRVKWLAWGYLPSGWQNWDQTTSNWPQSASPYPLHPPVISGWELKQGRGAFSDLSWEPANQATQIFPGSARVHKWPWKYHEYSFGDYKEILASGWVHRCGICEQWDRL